MTILRDDCNAWLDMKFPAQPSHEKVAGHGMCGHARETTTTVERARSQFGRKPRTNCQKSVKNVSFLLNTPLDRDRGFNQDRDFLNSRRRILPDAVLGTAFTKRTSRGCL